MAAPELTPELPCVILSACAAPEVGAQPLGKLARIGVVWRRMQPIAAPFRRVLVGVTRVLADEVAAVGIHATAIRAELYISRVVPAVAPHDAGELGPRRGECTNDGHMAESKYPDTSKIG